MNYWANIKKKYAQLSVSRVSRSLTTSVSSIFFGFSIFKKSGLIFADLIGQLVSCFYLFYKIWKQTIEFHKFISVKGIKNTAIRYKHFPQFNVASGLFEKASSHAPIFLLTVLFSSTDAGFFALALRFISAPVSLVSISIGDVFRQEASEAYAVNGNCHAIFVNTFRKLLIIAIPGFIIGFVFIKLFFVPVFGEKWELAADYSEIMCVMFFLQFTLSPLSSMFIIAEKQNIDMINNIVLFVMCILAFWLAKYYFNNSTVAIIFYVIVYSFKYIIEFLFSLKYSKGKNYARY
jgi:O-antigen/teichoic acid export membrane protein